MSDRWGTSYALDDRGTRVRFEATTTDFSLFNSFQTGSGAYPSLRTKGYRELLLRR
jgi:hypothetical protein